MAKTRRRDVPEPLDEGVLTIFVDGSMRSSPRRGGIGIRFVWIQNSGSQSDPWDHALPATEGATIQQMELEAPYQALRLAMGPHAPFSLQDFRKIEIRTDSEYVKEGVPRAINTWSKNGWVTRAGEAVSNISDWKALLTILRRVRREHHLPVSFEWKKGKKGKHAIAVDRLAKESSAGPTFGRSRPNVVRRKTTRETVERGAVKMEGQEMTVRIVHARYIPPPHRTSRYKYEVVDEQSPYHGKLDWAESDCELKRGHTYTVLVNQDQAAPRIERVLEEIVEDLSPYLRALARLGRPSTAREVADHLNRTAGGATTVDAVRRRLDRLAAEGRVGHGGRASSPGRPHLYEVVLGPGDRPKPRTSIN
jgi:ribonuclease HI